MCFIIAFLALITLWMVVLTKKTLSDRNKNKVWMFKNTMILKTLSEIKKQFDEIS